MKRCPECRRDYYDDTLLYCLDDGNALLEGPSPAEAATLQLIDSKLPTVKQPKGGEDGASDLTLPLPKRGAEQSRSKWTLADLLTTKRILSALGVLALFLLALYLVSGALTNKSQQVIDLTRVSLTPITNDPGYEGEPTFSPDGETIAYVSDRSGNFEIYIQQVSGGAFRNITENPADDVQPAYSPDGKQIAFVSTRSSDTSLRWEGYDLPLIGGDIWVMPALGGNARLIARNGNFPSWSHDGATLLYTSGPAFNNKIYRISSLGDTSQEIESKLNVEFGRPRFILYPSYSADDKFIVFEADSPTGFGPRDIWVMNASDGTVQHIAKGMCPKWNSDSTGIIYSSAERGKNFSLWQRSFPISDNSPPQPLTVGRGRDVQAAIARNGKQIAFAGLDLSSNVEVLDFDDDAGKPIGTPIPITSGRQISYFQTLSPDGQTAVFESRQGFGSHLWKAKQGDAPLQLTDDSNYDDTFPRWSPNGQSIAFTRKLAKDVISSAALWVMSPDSANPRQLVEKAGNMAWTGDSKGIVYFSYADRQLDLFDLTTGAKRKITDEPLIALIFAVTADSKQVIFMTLESGNVDLKVVPIEGGMSRRVVATPHQDYHPFVSPSGKWLYFQPDHKNVYRVPGPSQNWRPAEPQKVTNYPESDFFMDDPQISANGRRIIYTHGHLTGDIWLLNFNRGF